MDTSQVFTFGSAGTTSVMMESQPHSKTKQTEARDGQSEESADVEDATDAIEPPEIPPFSNARELTDVTLEVEGKELHVNRAVLAHYSPVFSRMFFGGFKENEQTKIPLPGKSYTLFTTFLKVMYPQRPDAEELISDENLVQLLELAEEYQVDNVKARCQDFIGEQLAEHYAKHYRNSRARNSSQSGIRPGMSLIPQSGAHTPTSPSTSTTINQMSLYIWMCDQYDLSRHRASVLSILIEHASDLDSLCNTPHYDLLPPQTKINLLEALCRKIDGSSEKKTGYKFPRITAFSLAGSAATKKQRQHPARLGK